LRDPFAYGRPAAPEHRAPDRPHVSAAAAQARPDRDPRRQRPRALIRHQDRNFTVKSGDLFADFRVVSITADQVVLERTNGERVVLKRPTKGD